MSIKYNGTTITAIKYNGTTITEVYYNGTKVWPDTINFSISWYGVAFYKSVEPNTTWGTIAPNYYDNATLIWSKGQSVTNGWSCSDPDNTSLKYLNNISIYRVTSGNTYINMKVNSQGEEDVYSGWICNSNSFVTANRVLYNDIVLAQTYYSNASA
jgi:hypothetical protein